MKQTTFEKLYQDALKEAAGHKIQGNDAEVILIPVCIARYKNSESNTYDYLGTVKLSKINQYEKKNK